MLGWGVRVRVKVMLVVMSVVEAFDNAGGEGG